MITQPYQRLQELSWKKPVSSNAPASSNITQEVFPLTDHQKIMQEIIPAKLKEIEFRENIRIIHCIESGSRAGASPPLTATMMCGLSMSDLRSTTFD